MKSDCHWAAIYSVVSGSDIKIHCSKCDQPCSAISTTPIDRHLLVNVLCLARTLLLEDIEDFPTQSGRHEVCVQGINQLLK